MVLETFDWSLFFGDEDDASPQTFTSATGETVDVNLTQNNLGFYLAGRDGFETNQTGGFTGGHFEQVVNFQNTSQTVTTTIDFTNNTESGADSVSDLSFMLYDIDSPSDARFQDEVTVLAFDENNNPLTVTLTATNPAAVSVSGNTATAVVGAGTGILNSVNTNQTDGNVEVSITGEVARVEIVYGSGPDAIANPANQGIGIGDLTFDLVAPPICFVKGTHIAVAGGSKPVQRLRVGDLVQTLDHGLQPIRWIGSRKIRADGRIAPVCIDPGALGNRRRLLVSPQHRLLVQGWKAQLFAGVDEVFVAAKHLVNGEDIRQLTGGTVEYFHVMFDQHEIVWAEGCPAESLFLGAESLRGLTAEGRAEVMALFPEIAHDAVRGAATARPCLTAKEAALVA